MSASPESGARLVRHAGDVLTFTLSGLPPGFHARLRTNLGRVDRVRDEVIRAHFERLPLAGASWRDVPMRDVGNGVWQFDFPLSEVGFFKAKKGYDMASGWGSLRMARFSDTALRYGKKARRSR